MSQDHLLGRLAAAFGNPSVMEVCVDPAWEASAVLVCPWNAAAAAGLHPASTTPPQLRAWHEFFPRDSIQITRVNTPLTCIMQFSQ